MTMEQNQNESSATQLFTVVVFSENNVGLLSQISNIFTRRGVNIESITASKCSIPDIHKITLTCRNCRHQMELIVGQMEKRIDVIRAFLFTDADVIYQEVALYKVPTERLLDEEHLEDIIRRHGARILEITRAFTIIEKTGHETETEALFAELKPYGIKQFVRSGRVAVTKSPVEMVDLYLAEQERRRLEIEQ